MHITTSRMFNFFFTRNTKFKRKRRRKTIIRPPNHHQLTAQSAEQVLANEDLLNLILLKLRERDRARFKSVCKNWYEIISGSRYVFKLPPPSDLLIRRYTRRSRPLFFPTVKYTTVQLDIHRPLPPTSEPFLRFLELNYHLNGIRVSQSCNGLLLCPTDVSGKSEKHKNYYVYNPTIDNARFIPLPDSVNEVTAMNLAFDPSISPHYKVVSLCRIHKPYFSYTQLHIYSSITGCWSVSNAVFPINSDHVDFSNGVYLNGAIHWPSHTEETSFYLDVENQCFRIMPMPPVQDDQARRTIRFFGESGGRLLLIDFHEPFTMKFDVFGLENDYSKWTVKYSVNFSYRVRFMKRFHILSVICGEEEDDLYLVVYLPGRDCEGKGLMTYSLRERLLEKLHSPVPGWDLKLMEEKGYSVVHPLIRTRFAV